MASDDETVQPFDSVSRVGPRTPRRRHEPASQAGYQMITITNSRSGGGEQGALTRHGNSGNSQNATPSISPSPSPDQDLIAIHAPGEDFITHQIPRRALDDTLPGVMAHIQDNTLWAVDALDLAVLNRRNDEKHQEKIYRACRQILTFIEERFTDGMTDNHLCYEMRERMSRHGANERNRAYFVGMIQIQTRLLATRAGFRASDWMCAQLRDEIAVFDRCFALLLSSSQRSILATCMAELN